MAKVLNDILLDWLVGHSSIAFVNGEKTHSDYP